MYAMKVGFYQSDVTLGDRRANLDRTAAALGGSRFDLMVLTELFATGYGFADRADVAAQAETVPGGLTTTALVEIARSKHAFIVGSLVEADGGRCYNTAVVAGPHGYVGRHRKAHLPEIERRYFDPGEPEAQVFDLDGVRIGLVICFESWFPEYCRRLALDGADILCHPANFGGTMSPDVIRTRAIENLVFTITANRVGGETVGGAFEEFRGGSRIVDPEGTILHEAGREEAVGLADIDPTRARTKASPVCRDFLAEIRRASSPRL
jgi:predicted amidohydrolase